jgi:hypothetical protein
MNNKAIIFMIVIMMAIVSKIPAEVNSQEEYSTYTITVDDITVFTPNAFIQVNWEYPFMNHTANPQSASGKKSGTYDETYSTVFFKTDGAVYSVVWIVIWAEARNQTVTITAYGNGQLLLNKPEQIYHERLIVKVPRVTAIKWPEYPTDRDIAEEVSEIDREERETDRATAAYNWFYQNIFNFVEVMMHVLILVGIVIIIPRMKRKGAGKTATETWTGPE